LSDLAQQIAQLHGQQAYIVKASRAGVVSNLQAAEGQQAQADIPVLSLVPENHVLTAQLLVPVRSAGFLSAGQPLKIRYDAFPYQKFGLYPGAVLEVSDTVLLPDELLRVPVTVREPVFRVTAKLAQPTVNAYGRHFSLKPGMTLSADVQLAERSLLQWLLEPIYSLRGRL
uniref:HlyD family efflux transporter periplasmic adaptor subunit n=1 Tax=uncultured Microbulbifer sp. TaxID=348147 RepID=UPI00260BD22E